MKTSFFLLIILLTFVSCSQNFEREIRYLIEADYSCLDDEFITYPINGIKYNKSPDYVDIEHLYYCTGEKIFYAKKDFFWSIISFFNFTMFLEGLSQVKWYCYDLNTGETVKIKTKGYSFITQGI